MSPLAPAGVRRLPPDLPFSLHVEPDWLLLESPQPLRMLSWSIQRGGLVGARRLAWHTVRNDELTPDVDPVAFFAERLAARGWSDAVGLLTSRAVDTFRLGESRVGDVRALSLFTADLGNALRIGVPAEEGIAAYRPGTINSFTWVSVPLSDVALIESLAMVVQARTLALLENAPGGVTGTGTDCAVIACPPGHPQRPYAGLHTPVAHAIGGSVAAALQPALADWLAGRG